MGEELQQVVLMHSHWASWHESGANGIHRIPVWVRCPVKLLGVEEHTGHKELVLLQTRVAVDIARHMSQSGDCKHWEGEQLLNAVLGPVGYMDWKR